MAGENALIFEDPDQIAYEASRWIGTPYRHQASLRGVGCDCLGLLRGVWRALLGPEPEQPGPYTPDWSEPSREERLLAAARRRLIQVDPESAVKAGEVLLFRMRRDAPAKHLGICIDPHVMVHAHSRLGVVDAGLDRAWRRRLAARFHFPAPASLRRS